MESPNIDTNKILEGSTNYKKFLISVCELGKWIELHSRLPISSNKSDILESKLGNFRSRQKIKFWRFDIDDDQREKLEQINGWDWGKPSLSKKMDKLLFDENTFDKIICELHKFIETEERLPFYISEKYDE